MTWNLGYALFLIACGLAIVVLVRWRLGFWPWQAPRPGCDHVPGERDWVGRPMGCARCGAIPFVDMSRAESERFYGRAAIVDWNAEALRRVEELRAVTPADRTAKP